MENSKMQSHDLLGRILWKIRYYRLEIFCLCTNFILKPIFAIKGVKMGIGAKFYGFPIIIRSPFSTIEIGNNVCIRSDKSSNLFGTVKKSTIATINKGAKLIIGDDTGISAASITAFQLVEIGNNVLIGANTFITDSDWHSLNPLDRYTNIITSPVHINNNVWIGANSIILKGITIGENSIIGANSVVVNDIPTNVIAAGNPCTVKKLITVKNIGKSNLHGGINAP